jgi:hypothetical protein
MCPKKSILGFPFIAKERVSLTTKKRSRNMETVIQDVPDGEYIVDIMEMKSTVDIKDRKVVTWLLKVADGQYLGSVLPKKYYLVSPKVLGFLKKELHMVGVEANNGEEFEARKTAAYGKRIRITVVTNDQGFRVIYVKEVVGMSDTPPPVRENIGW